MGMASHNMNSSNSNESRAGGWADVNKAYYEGSRSPRYAQPNLSFTLPEYTNMEQDVIKQVFGPASFTSLSSIPNTLGPAFLARLRASKIEQLRNSTMSIESSPKRYTGKAKTFNEYEYIPSDYGLADELKRRERRENATKMVSDKPFLPSNATSQSNTGLFEDCPYMSDPFDAVRSDAARDRWISESKVLAGPFRPAGVEKLTEKPTRAMLSEILTDIFHQLEEDWPEAEPTVLSTQEDIIVIYFNLDNCIPNAILAYMNVMAHRNDIITKHMLQRVVEGWNIATEDNHLMFSFKPPWVHAKIVN